MDDSGTGAPRRSLVGWLKLAFGLSERVGPRDYLTVGLTLMVAKYLADATAVHLATGNLWTPIDYLIPLHSLREDKLAGAPRGFFWAMAVWTLPFLWIGVGMTMRRAVDAGRSPWLSVLFFVPLVNYVLMIWLARIPSRAEAEGWVEEAPEPVVDHRLRSAMIAVFLSVGLAMAMVAFSVYVLRSYGMALFGGTPVVLGMVAAFVHNYPHPRSTRSTGEVIGLSVVMTGGALGLFAMEGLICLLMALPISAFLAFTGGMLGRAIALHAPGTKRHAAMALLLLPGIAGLEKLRPDLPEHEVVTTIEVDAPREVVWQQVVAFSELPPPESWFFRMGIAYPVRARIEGSGVGAVRHCEFSTGAFVEPITCWDAPARLSFDVVAQPPPMHEWTFWENVHPPHLDGYLRSTGGEFRLIELPGGRTRVEASTWYEVDIHPQAYWSLYVDALIHAIHGRVLEHVARESERS